MSPPPAPLPLQSCDSWMVVKKMQSSNIDVALEKYINNEINRLHERASRIVYSDYTPSFEGLHNKDNFFSIIIIIIIGCWSWIEGK